MKPQDIIFLIVSIVLLFYFWKKPEWLVVAALLCVAISIPLFSFWIFFTAQRLVYYAFFLLLFACLLFLAKKS